MHYGKCVQSALKPALGTILTIMLAVGLAPAVAIAAESTSGGGRVDSSPALASSLEGVAGEQAEKATKTESGAAGAVPELLASSLLRFTAKGVPCISADVALGSGDEEAFEPVIGSFVVDGMAYAVIGEGKVKLVSAAVGSAAAGGAPASQASSDEIVAQGESAVSDVAATAAADAATAGGPAQAAAGAAGDAAEVGDSALASALGDDAGELGLAASVEDVAAAPATLAVPASVSYGGAGYAVVAIGEQAFAGCTAEVVALPASVADVDARALRPATIQRVEVDPANSSYLSYDGALYGADPISLLSIPGGRAGAVRILSQTEVVAPGALSHCPQVTAIEADADGAAYASWDGLLYSSDGTTLVKVPAGAAEATIREGCTTVAAGALAGCAELRTIYAPATIELVDPNVFEDVEEAEGAPAEADVPAQLSSLMALEGGTGRVLHDNALNVVVNVAGSGDADLWSDRRFTVVTSNSASGEAGLSIANLDDPATARSLTRYHYGANITTYSLKHFALDPVASVTPSDAPVIESRNDFGQNYSYTCDWYREREETLTIEFGPNWLDDDGAYGTPIKYYVVLSNYHGIYDTDRQFRVGDYIWWYPNDALVMRGVPGERNYTITFDTNGGIGEPPSPISTTYNTALPDLADTPPTRPGYTFAGWYAEGKIKYQFWNADGTVCKTADYAPYWGEDVTVKALWEKKATQTVSFNNNGGSGGQATSVEATKGQAMPAISKVAPKRTGYTFQGWYDTSANSGGKKYYSADGSSACNWDKDTDTTLFARWTPITYSVRYFDKAGNYKATDTKTYGETFTLRGNPGWTAAGYTAQGWARSANQTSRTHTFGQSVSNLATTQNANVDFYVAETPNPYNVRYFDKAGNHIATDQKTYGTTFTLRGDPGRTAAGYTAQGWARGANQTARAYTFGQSVSNLATSGNFDLYVAETPNTYNVRYFTKDGTHIGTDAKTYDAWFNLRGNPNRTHPAYTAQGWARSAGQASASHAFGFWTHNLATSGNFDLYLAETANTYTIAYDTQGGTLGDRRTSYTFETADFALAVPARVGYTFAGWEVAGAQGSGVVVAGGQTTVRQGTWGNLTCTAKWQPNEYAVTLDAAFPGFAQSTAYEGYAPYGVSKDAGAPSVTATFDSPMPAASMPQATGYAFEGYFDDAGTCYYDADGSSARAWDKPSAATLHGRWSLNVHHLTLNVGNGEVPDAAARGWTRDEGEAGLYRLDYSIESRRIQLPSNAAKPGYDTFLGWTGDGISKPTKVVIVQPYDLRDKAFVGSFSGLVGYTATLDLAGGSFAEPPEGWTQAEGLWTRGFNVESEAFALPTPTRAGHDFKGWALIGPDGSTGSPDASASVPKGTVGSRSYQAVWEARSYTITWDYSGQTIDGKTSSSSTQRYGQPIAFPSKPSAADSGREHYAFVGWFTAAEGGDLVKPGSYLAESDSTYYARWAPVEYVVHLHLEGGSIEQGGEVLPLAPDGHYDLPYTVEDELVLPTVSDDEAAAKPVQEGMEFKGWVACEPDGSVAEGALPALVVTVPKGSSGDRHYKATWSFAMRFEVPSAVGFRFDLADDDAFADAPYGPVSTVEGEGVEFRSLSRGRLYVADLQADVTGAEPDAIVTDRSKVMLRCMGAAVEDQGYGYLPLPRASSPEGLDPSDLPGLGFGEANALAPMGKLPLRYDVSITDPLTTLAGEVDGKKLASIVFTVAFA